MNYIEILTDRCPALSGVAKEMEQTVSAICRMYGAGGKLLLCGNGGSAADCEHISGELLKGFLSKRPHADAVPNALQKGVATIPLPSLSALVSAFANDVDPLLVYAQLVYALGREHDVFMCLSTSGNAQNVVKAAEVAKSMGLVTVALTGGDGGRLADVCDIVICVPERQTHLVQELHLPVYHAICAEVEKRLFD